jgi:hypothetical protein
MATTKQGSYRFALLAAVVCCCLTAVFLGAAFWQHNQANSKLDDADAHDASASLFQQAEAEGTEAGNLMQQYVASGDATLVPQINDHTSAGVTLLTSAVAQSGVDAQTFLDGGTALVQAEGQIIALRQAGDVQGAITGLQQLSTQFQQFVDSQDSVVASEQAAAAAARDDSDQADTLSGWMIVGSAVFAMGAVASGILFVRGTASRRRTLDALPSA